MKEEKIYEEVFNKLFSSLKTDYNDKFFNTELKKEYAIGNYYPDIILTKKGTSEVNFIIEITAPKQANLDYIMTVVKPISELGGTFYLLVPKSEKNHIEKICRENQIHPRYGVYFKQGNELKILFE
jgi:hypothetical protein